MASVINSARQSTASIFDTFGTLANSANKLVSTASRSIDSLDAKVELMHTRIVTNSRAQLVNVTNDEITKAALEHMELMREVHNKVYSDEKFDQKLHFEQALKTITEAVQA